MIHSKYDSRFLFQYVQAGGFVKAESIFLTSYSSINKFTSQNVSIKPELLAHDFVHIHFILSDMEGKSFSYVRLMGNSIIHRISDVTSQIPELQKRVLIVGVHHKSYVQIGAKRIADFVLAEVKRLGFVGKSTTSIHSQINVYSSQYLKPDSVLGHFSDFSSKIKFIRSDDLIYSIHERLPEWQALLA